MTMATFGPDMVLVDDEDRLKTVEIGEVACFFSDVLDSSKLVFWRLVGKHIKR